MLPGIPVGTSPFQADLDSAFALANRGVLSVRGARSKELWPADLAELKSTIKVATGRVYPDFSDPPGSVSIGLEHDGKNLGILVVGPELTVRWTAWRAAADVASPSELGKWLEQRGFPKPVQALHQSALPEFEAENRAFLASAPAALGRALEGLLGDPWGQHFAAYKAAFEACVAEKGSKAKAAWAVAEWFGSRRGAWGEGLGVERVADGLLRAFGVHELIALAKDGVPETALPGVARFLVENVTSRGFEIKERLPESVRASLVESVRTQTSEENARRAAFLLLDEGAMVPAGTTLLGSSNSGVLRHICGSREAVVAGDGYDLVRFDNGGKRVELTKLMRPNTPLGVRDGEVWFLHPSGPRSIPVAGGIERKRSGPWFGLPARRLNREVQRFYRERAALFSAMAGADSTFLALDIDSDEREAYEAFGGDLPWALRSRFYWASERSSSGVLVRMSTKGDAARFPLKGRPFLLKSGADEALLVLSEMGPEKIEVVQMRGDKLVSLGEVGAPSDRVLGAHVRQGGGVILHMTAPLGDVLVTVLA